MSDLIGIATKRRFFAMVVDNLVAMLLSLLCAANLPDSVGQARWAVVVAVYLGYYLVQEGTWATTLGKRLFGLRVSLLDGSAPGWREASWRTVTRPLEVNPALLGVLPGGLAVALTRRHQRLGDILARTVVVERNPLVQERGVQQRDEADEARGG